VFKEGNLVLKIKILILKGYYLEFTAQFYHN